MSIREQIIGILKEVKPNKNLDELTAEEIIEIVRKAGISGLGGATFPTYAKIQSALGKAKTVIVNCAECEPFICADHRIMLENPAAVINGVKILLKALGVRQADLAVEDNKAEAIEKLNVLLKDYPHIELVVLPTRYPQGAEKQLIQSITKREVPPGQLPVSVGCAVFNVSTYAAIYRAVRLGMPLIQRIVTISGEAIAEPQNFIVRIGTPFHDLIEVAGGLNDKTERVISGGPMMGFAQSDLSVPVIKATNSILCLLKDQNGAAENPVCLRCGKCVAVCPMRLQPLYMYRYEIADNLKELDRLHLMDCIECGSCAFTCPGKLPLVESFRKGKALLRAAMAERKAKEGAK